MAGAARGGGALTGGWAKRSPSLCGRSEPGGCGERRGPGRGMGGRSRGSSFPGCCCALASNSAERILGDETHGPTKLLPWRDLPVGGGGADCGRVMLMAMRAEDLIP